MKLLPVHCMVSGHNLELRVLRLEVSVYNVYFTIGEIVTSALYGTVLKPNSWTYGSLRFMGIILRFSDLSFLYTM